MAQPFNPDRSSFTGEMFPIAEQVGFSSNSGNGAFSLSENGVLVYGAGRIANREVVWRDRTGKRLAVIAPPGPINTVSLSPDEKRVALSKDRAGTESSDVWVNDLALGMLSRVTLQTGLSRDAVWSPDGSQIAFSDTFAIYVKAITGTTPERQLVRAGINIRALDWSRDSKFLLYQFQSGRGTGTDLWLLPLEEGRKPIPYLETNANEFSGQFSPDGQWIAYASNESGQSQIYVQPVPANGDRRRVSPVGGDEPRWRRGGAELFYISADQKLMAVPVETGARFQSGTPQALFELEPLYGNFGRNTYTPSADGQRFLVTTAVGDATPITVVLNWRAALKR